MNWKKTFFWIGVIALAFGLLWNIWNIFAGEILGVRDLTMPPAGEGEESGTVWTLPFSISHSWDILVAPLFVLTFSWIMSMVRTKEDEFYDLLGGLVFGLFFGLLGWVIDLLFGLLYGLGIGLFGNLLCSLGIGLFFSPVRGLLCSLGYGLGFGFVCGIFWTMPLGAVFGLVIILPSLVVLILLMGKSLHKISQATESSPTALPAD